MKQYFAERNKYVIPEDIILTKGINTHVINAISNCYSRLKNELETEDERVERAAPWLSYNSSSYYQLCLSVWTRFFNKRSTSYGYETGDNDAIQSNLISHSTPWYIKLSLIEFTIDYMRITFEDSERLQILNRFIDDLNDEFERTHYGYRVINDIITDIITEPEKTSIKKALTSSEDVVKAHLERALVLYSQRPDPDYKNSIKESISAIEALFRIKTGESKFGPAYKKIKEAITIHPRIQEIIQKVYDYTNQPDTGIRHSKVIEGQTMVPGEPECQLMLVSCSSIINYVQEKYAQITNDIKAP